jgi:hypothetical protein
MTGNEVIWPEEDSFAVHPETNMTTIPVNMEATFMRKGSRVRLMIF